MQSGRGTLLLKLCRDQSLQSNRIFLQTFIMPTPIMYYKSLPSHSASWSHQYSTAHFSFSKNKLIYIFLKCCVNLLLLRKVNIQETVWMDVVWIHTHSSAVFSQPYCLLLPSFLAISWSQHHSPQYCFILYYSSLFHLFPAALSKHLNSKPDSKPMEDNSSFSIDFSVLLIRFSVLLPLTILPATPVTCLFRPKALYLLGATTAFRAVMKSVPHCCSQFSLFFGSWWIYNSWNIGNIYLCFYY